MQTDGTLCYSERGDVFLLLGLIGLTCIECVAGRCTGAGLLGGGFSDLGCVWYYRRASDFDGAVGASVVAMFGGAGLDAGFRLGSDFGL